MGKRVKMNINLGGENEKKMMLYIGNYFVWKSFGFLYLFLFFGEFVIIIVGLMVINKMLLFIVLVLIFIGFLGVGCFCLWIFYRF